MFWVGNPGNVLVRNPDGSIPLKLSFSPRMLRLGSESHINPVATCAFKRLGWLVNRFFVGWCPWWFFFPSGRPRPQESLTGRNAPPPWVLKPRPIQTHVQAKDSDSLGRTLALSLWLSQLGT